MLPTTAPSLARAPFTVSIVLAAAAVLAADVVPHATQAQTPETIINRPCEICQPEAVEAANFDAGSATDLVVGEAISGRLSFYSGTGSGSGTGRLGSRSVLSTAVTTPTALASGDLTGNGSLDLVVVDGSDVLLFEGNGDGTFGTASTLGTQSGPEDLVVADVDNANGPDVAVADPAADAVTVYLNDGSGAVGSTVTLSAGGVASIDAADLGADDDADLVAAASSNDELLVFESDADGTFTTTTITSSFADPEHVALASVNPDTDGHLDLLAYSANTSGDPNLAWFDGNGDGTFGSSPNAITTSEATFSALLPGDYAGDDKTDFAIVGADATVYENTGGSFSSTSMSELSGVSGVASAADFTGNSHLDLVGVSDTGEQAWLREGDGTGSFTDETLVLPPDIQVPSFGTTLLQTGDVDNSGSKDVIMAAENAVVWYSNDGSGHFGPRQTVAETSTSTLVVTDVDDDGRADLFFQELVSFEFSLMRYEWDGAGGFTETQVTTRTPRQLAIADLDQNDQYDVVIGNSNGLHVGMNQDGSFTFSTVNSSVTSIDDVAVADVNEDDDLDVLFANSFSDKIAYHAGNGSGGFGSEQTAVSPFAPLRVLARDLNDDGHTDLVTSGPKVFLYDPSTSSFGASTDYFGEGVAITLADVNGDSAPDLIQGTDWRANDGAGSFGSATSSATSYASVPSVTAVAAGPIDGDTDLDPLTASSEQDKLSWFKNQGSVLPVELTSFDGAQTGEDAVRLTWRTASETNNAGFRVQHRAVDGGTSIVKPSRATGMTSGPRDASTSSSEGTGADWQTLGRVDGAGTTDRPQSYRFVVEDLAPGTHQFRLQQVDLDGTTRVHAPITVDVGMQQPVRLTAPAPHPVQNLSTLSFAVKEAQQTTVRLYNLLGQAVATLYQGTPPAGEAQSLLLDASSLASGTYVVHLQTGSRTEIQRVTVVH